MMEKVGVIGCGQMGSGITRVWTRVGKPVVIVQDYPGFIINRPGRKTGE